MLTYADAQTEAVASRRRRKKAWQQFGHVYEFAFNFWRKGAYWRAGRGDDDRFTRPSAEAGPARFSSTLVQLVGGFSSTLVPLIRPSFLLLRLREAHTSYVPARPSSRNLDAHPPAAAAHALDLDFLDVRGGNRSTRGSAHKKEAAQEGATRAPLKNERDGGVVSGGM